MGFKKKSVGASRNLSLKQVADREGFAYDTVLEWVLRGVNGVKLYASKLGKCWRVTPEDLDEFRRQCTEAAREAIDAVESPQVRRRRASQKSLAERAAAARKRLAAMGV